MFRLTGVQITGTKTGAAALKIGDGAKGVVSRLRVQVVAASTVSLSFKGVVTETALAIQTYGVALAYRDVSTTSDTAGSTAITANGVYDVDASGLDVYLDLATNGSGVDIYVEPLSG